jgi:hypothetical protein
LCPRAQVITLMLDPPPRTLPIFIGMERPFRCGTVSGLDLRLRIMRRIELGDRLIEERNAGGNGAGKKTKSASSQTARKVSCALCSRIPSFDEVHNEALKVNKFCDQQLATTAA